MALSNSNFLKNQHVKDLKKKNSYRKAHLLANEEKKWLDQIIIKEEIKAETEQKAKLE